MTGLACFAASLLAATSASAQGTVKTGVVMSYSGQFADPGAQIETMRAELGAGAALAHQLGAEEFESMIRARMAACGPEIEAALVQALPPDQQWQGLHRYWEKKEEKPAAS